MSCGAFKLKVGAHCQPGISYTDKAKKVYIHTPLVSCNFWISFVLIVFHWATRCVCHSRNVVFLFVRRKYVTLTMHRWGMSLEKHPGQYFVSLLQTLWVICSFSDAPKKGILRVCILSWWLACFFWKTRVGVLWRMVADHFRCAYSEWLQTCVLIFSFGSLIPGVGNSAAWEPPLLDLSRGGKHFLLHPLPELSFFCYCSWIFHSCISFGTLCTTHMWPVLLLYMEVALPKQ